MRKISEMEQVYRALGDENRLRIIQLLFKGQLNAGELLQAMNIAQSTLSHHMKALVESDLVKARRDGKWTYYSLNEKRFDEAGGFLFGFCGKEEAAPAEKTVKKPVKAAEQPAEKKPVKAAEQPAEKKAEKPAEKKPAKPAEKKPVKIEIYAEEPEGEDIEDPVIRKKTAEPSESAGKKEKAAKEKPEKPEKPEKAEKPSKGKAEKTGKGKGEKNGKGGKDKADKAGKENKEKSGKKHKKK